MIRMLLKMSFYNECLSSLTLQESNPTYTYTRCLEYYSRVQDFCLTLFSQVAVFPSFHPQIVHPNNEEIRQILSIVNYKIVLYNLLIHGAKGLESIFRKITGCLHALSSLLYEDDVSAKRCGHA